MTTKARIASYQIAIEVQSAFYKEFPCHKTSSAAAGRVVSGLLKSAAKAGLIERSASSGRVSGNSVYYVMTAEQREEFKNKAIARAKTYDFFKG